MKTFIICVVVIFIAMCLITLSGCRKDSSSTAGRNGTSDKGVIPILLGKNFEEVKGIIGTPDGMRENPLGSNIPNISWSYGNFPAEQAETFVYFEDKYVKIAATLFYEQNFLPGEMVPGQIMKADPAEYRTTGPAFMIIWRLDGNSYLVTVSDDNNECSTLDKQVDTDTGQLLERYVLVEGGKKWRNKKIRVFHQQSGNPSAKELIGDGDYSNNFSVYPQ